MPRLDVQLVELKIAASRERAKEMIKSGFVKVNGITVIKPSIDVSSDESIEFCGEKLRYVGRGGLKLENAIEKFNIELNDKICIDIGASTGGFTDCMLENGAKKVFAVDVGHDQLAEKLCNDSRVVNVEGTDIRNLNVDFFGDYVDFISIDVSFISLTKVLPKAFELLKNCGEVSALIKPQFEAGKSGIGKKGIVKDKKVHMRVLNEICDFCRNIGFFPINLICSGIKGGSGNIEYMIHLKKNESNFCGFDYKYIVDEAFAQLNGGIDK